MFRNSPADSAQDARLQQRLEMVTEEFFAVDQTAAGLDFATIERRAHEAGRKVARRLSEQAASQCASPPSGSIPVPIAGSRAPGPSRSGRWRPATDRSPSKKHGNSPAMPGASPPESTAPGLGSPPL